MITGAALSTRRPHTPFHGGPVPGQRSGLPKVSLSAGNDRTGGDRLIVVSEPPLQTSFNWDFLLFQSSNCFSWHVNFGWIVLGLTAGQPVRQPLPQRIYLYTSCLKEIYVSAALSLAWILQKCALRAGVYLVICLLVKLWNDDSHRNTSQHTVLKSTEPTVLSRVHCSS